MAIEQPTDLAIMKLLRATKKGAIDSKIQSRNIREKAYYKEREPVIRSKSPTVKKKKIDKFFLVEPNWFLCFSEELPSAWCRICKSLIRRFIWHPPGCSRASRRVLSSLGYRFGTERLSVKENALRSTRFHSANIEW